MNKKIPLFLSSLVIGIIVFALWNNKKTPTENLPEKPIVILIASYNNADWYKKNLDSIFKQQYSNYRAIYIDDCSKDGTHEFVKNYIEAHGQSDRFTIIHNEVNRGAVANLFLTAHMCKDDEIIVHLDGDDWFKNEYVLQRVNQEYANPDTWMTYGQFEIYPGSRKGWCREIPSVIHEKNLYRDYEWITSHLRTFYAWLFKRIKLEDCLHQSKWLPVSYDMAFVFPMLEMAREHTKFIPDILYVYNCATPSNDHKLHLAKQQYFNKYIRLKNRYLKVTQSPISKPKNKRFYTDMVIFSENNPLRLQALLESTRCFVSGLDQIHVLCEFTNDIQKQTYEKVLENFPLAILHPYNKNEKTTLSTTLESLMQQTDFALCAHDNIIVKDHIDIKQCAHALDQTHAYGFYLTLGKNIVDNPALRRNLNLPSFVDLDNNISAWQFNCGEYDWKSPRTLTFGLYRSSTIKNLLRNTVFNSSQQLKELLDGIPFNMNQIGLILSHSPAIVLENNNATNQSNMFDSGLKMDIDTIAHIKNKRQIVAQHVPLTHQNIT